MTTDKLLDQQTGQLIDWLHERAMTPVKIDELQREVLSHLRGYGFNIYRMHIGMPMLHPLYSIGAYNWKQGRGSYQETFARGTGQRDEWLKSPIKPMYEAGLNERRFCVQEPEVEQFPMLVDMRDEGVTEHFIQVTGFSDRSIPTDDQEGVVLTWTTTDEEGFSEPQINFLSKLRLPLSALLKSLAQRKLTEDILDTYLGAYSGSRVLSGTIQRGDVELIKAVILFCDLRDSSLLAKQYSPKEFLDLLNQYFEVTAGTVIQHGGEVLRFIGDASLAIFPIQKFDSTSTACQMALDASKETLRLCDLLNNKRKAQGEHEIQFGIGLHKGEVLYGNMGTASRLEFTVIGEAANEAARIEGLCKELDQSILASDLFANCGASDWLSHGHHKLKNIADEIEIFSPVFS